MVLGLGLGGFGRFGGMKDGAKECEVKVEG